MSKLNMFSSILSTYTLSDDSINFTVSLISHINLSPIATNTSQFGGESCSATCKKQTDVENEILNNLWAKSKVKHFHLNS